MQLVGTQPQPRAEGPLPFQGQGLDSEWRWAEGPRQTERSKGHGAQTFIAGVWEVTLGRGGSQEFSVLPRCALWEHLVPWFLLFFSFLSCGTYCSIEDPVRWPTSPRPSSKLACKVEINHGQVPLWGFHRKDTVLPTEEDGWLPKFSPPIPPASGPPQGEARLVCGGCGVETGLHLSGH